MDQHDDTQVIAMPAKLFAATAMPDREWWSGLWPEPEAVLCTMGLEGVMAAVDLCCGDGYFIAHIVRRSVYSIDLDARFLALARTEVERAKVSACVFVQSDARDLARLSPDRFDYVFLTSTFHGVERKTGLVREVGAALRSGGGFRIANWHRRSPKKTIIHEKPRGSQSGLRMIPDGR